MAQQVDLLSKIKSITDPTALEVIGILLSRIEKLEIEVASLRKDSSNSSKPPSSDIVKPESERRQPGKRKQGGQHGHKGQSRIKFKPEEIDNFIELDCDTCPDCEQDLSIGSICKSKIDQNVELTDKPLIKTECKRNGRFCSCCNKIVYPALPESFVEGQFFGVRLQSLIAYMKGNLGSSYSELTDYCKDIFGIEVSRGMLNEIICRLSESLEHSYRELGEAIRRDSSINVDESGWKDNGNTLWVWIFCNKLLAYFKISETRASSVLRDVLGDTFNGALTSDFYSAYIAYNNEKQQFCLAHLIRDVRFLEALPDAKSQEFGGKVLKSFKSIFHLWHRRDDLSQEVFSKKVRQVKTILHNYLCRIKLQKGKAKTLQKRLLKRWRNLFMFFDEPKIYQPTNNIAEQTLRHLIRIRRHTQGSRSQRGQKWIERIMTVLESCRKQNRSPWDFILQSFQAFCGHKNYPTLLTA